MACIFWNRATRLHHTLSFSLRRRSINIKLWRRTKATETRSLGISCPRTGLLADRISGRVVSKSAYYALDQLTSMTVCSGHGKMLVSRCQASPFQQNNKIKNGIYRLSDRHHLYAQDITTRKLKRLSWTDRRTRTGRKYYGRLSYLRKKTKVQAYPASRHEHRPSTGSFMSPSYGPS